MKNYLDTSKMLLKKFNPKLAYQLATIDPSPLQFCQTKQNEINLKRTYEGTTYYYHSTDSAIKQALKWFESLALDNVIVLYVYGVGLGYYYEAAKEWLKKNPDHSLVFLEEDLGVLHRLFETERGVEMAKNRQVHFYYFTNVHDDKALFNELSWIYLFCPFIFSALPLYQEVNPEGCQDLSHQLSYDYVQKQAIVKEYREYGISFFRNFYQNILQLPQALLGNKLFGQFQNIPAIICGAGPSLQKNIDLLATLKDKALIFGGGSALNALTSRGVTPHFGCGIDPNPSQYDRVSATAHFKVPFFYRSRLYPLALEAIQGPRLYLTGTGGYEISEWFEKELGIEGDVLDEGHNVVNFCIEIAQAMGCNPLIFVGVDLAFTNNYTYAEGVVSERDAKILAPQLSLTPDTEVVTKHDIEGNPIQTLWKWIIESDWTSDFAKEHPESTLINATEGGLGFKDIPNLTLQEVADTYLQENLHCDELVKEKLALCTSSITLERVIELMKAMQASLKQCREIITILRNEMEELTRKIKQKEEYPNSLETHQSRLAEMELEEEIAYQYILGVFNIIYMRARHRTVQELQFPRRKIVEKTLNLRKIDLHLQRLIFLDRVAQVNEELIRLNLEKYS